MAWFEPHVAFRFPLLGQTHQRAMTLSLRTALELRNVLGEGSAGGTVHCMAPWLERIELCVQGLYREHFAIAVNGRVLPLQHTGTVGEYVPGVRHKAWNPSSARHPSTAAHTPLTFNRGPLKRTLPGRTRARHAARQQL